LVADLKRCYFGETPDGTGYLIWLAEHERGYRRLDTGDYQVLRQKSVTKEPRKTHRRFDPTSRTEKFIDRPIGRPLPEDIADLLRYKGGVGDGTPLGLAPGGRGVVGEVPPVPSVVICPKCGDRNLLEPLGFDERSSTWYTVRIG
jgi:hypothetical protein